MLKDRKFFFAGHFLINKKVPSLLTPDFKLFINNLNIFKSLVNKHLFLFLVYRVLYVKIIHIKVLKIKCNKLNGFLFNSKLNYLSF